MRYRTAKRSCKVAPGSRGNALPGWNAASVVDMPASPSTGAPPVAGPRPSAPHPRQGMPPLVRGRPGTGEDAPVTPTLTSPSFSLERGVAQSRGEGRDRNDDDVALRADEREPARPSAIPSIVDAET
jgi:hypothetical protein